MTDIVNAVEIKDVRKTFKIPLEASSGIKQKLINIVKGRKGYREFSPLNGVSFDIKKGDFFGIVGRNGSGKSTLLKTIAGIYSPSGGAVRVNGTLVPFIELGVGFNPELTGRENVFLNGALLGFSRVEMELMYADIVDFAELHDFMDQRLKNYSSGMQVRLAFSIAIRARADILLLDEVLAVGDETFQKKCYAYFDKLKRDKKTVILVTHDMSAVERFCNRAVFIDNGEVKMIGRPHKVAAAYSRINTASFNKSINNKHKQKSDFKIQLLDSKGAPKVGYQYNETMTVRLEWEIDKVQNVGVAIFKDNGEYVFGPNTAQDKYDIKEKSHLAEYIVDLNLNEGEYFIKAGLMGATDSDVVDFIEEGPSFTVGRDYDSGRWGGVSKLKYRWK